MASPTSRTLNKLRSLGYLAGVVERFNAHVPPKGIRIDLWGFADVAAVRADRNGVLFIQCCSATDHARRVAKVRSIAAVSEIIKAGNRIEVWSWRKRSSGKWHLRREPVMTSELV